MQKYSSSVAKARDTQSCATFIARASRRPQTPAQKAVAPLAPISEACAARGLKITPENKEVRLRAVNRYFDFLPFDWIKESFKELLNDSAAIFVLADAIECGVLTW